MGPQLPHPPGGPKFIAPGDVNPPCFLSRPILDSSTITPLASDPTNFFHHVNSQTTLLAASYGAMSPPKP